MDGPWRPLRTLRSQLELLVGGLLVLLLVSAVGTLLVQRQVTSTQDHLRKVLRPAQVAVASLGEAYVDQETGARGYQLTAEAVFLQPYNSGRLQAARLRRQLGRELVGDPTSRRLLAQADQAAAAWMSQAAVPETSQPQAVVSHHAQLRLALTGKRLFDTLRARLGHLRARVNELASTEVAAINSAQAIANWLTIAAGGAGLILVVIAILVLRNSLSRPLTRLVAQVQRVAGGDLAFSVDVSGPEELATVGRAVEAMRVRILSQASQAMEMRRALDLAEGSERIARGLHDRVIRRLSGTGLRLQSAAGRHPAVAPGLAGAVEEIDNAIRELRSVIFGLDAGHGGSSLRTRVLALVSEHEAGLGLTPKLHFEGIPGAQIGKIAGDELVVTLREILSDVTRHRPRLNEAEIKISLANGMLRLAVTANGPAPPGKPVSGTGELGGLPDRAQLLGGTCTVSRRAAGFTVVWAIPANERGNDQRPVLAPA